MRPFRQRSSVLLPQPLGPAISRTSPRRTSSDTSASAGSCPRRYLKLKCSTAIRGSSAPDICFRCYPTAMSLRLNYMRLVDCCMRAHACQHAVLACHSQKPLFWAMIGLAWLDWYSSDRSKRQLTRSLLQRDTVLTNGGSYGHYPLQPERVRRRGSR